MYLSLYKMALGTCSSGGWLTIVTWVFKCIPKILVKNNTYNYKYMYI
jgi:hypothetical protein